MVFQDDPLDSDRVYDLRTDRKLVPKETELSDMKMAGLGKQDTKSTYGSSALR